MRPLAEAIVLGIGVLALGCGSDKEFESQPPFKNEEDIKVWATSASAVGVYAHAHEALAVADGQVAHLVMAGGGLRAEHVPWLLRAGIRKFHVGSSVRPGGSWDKAHVDPDYVRSWRTLLDDHARRLRPA